MKIKNFLTDTYYIFIITVVIIFLTEIILYSFHKIYKIRYFENYYESKLRYGHYDVYLDIVSKKRDLIKNRHKEKIAIFGGSSAKGFGVYFSFYDILNHVLDDNYIVHNYSLNEASFNNNQSLVLKKVIKFYDKIIIYAGHNEIYPFLIDQNRFVTLPDDNSIGFKKYYNYRNYYLASIDQIFLGKKSFFTYEYFKINFINNSRIFNILQKIIFLLNKDHISFSLKKKPSENYLKIDNYGKNTNKIIIDKFDKEIIVNNYIQTLITLKKNNPNKHFIIPQVMSNYFYPPFSNYVNIKNNDELINLEQEYVRLYSNLFSNKFKNKNYFMSSHESSHDYLIDSLICLNKNNYITKKCHDLSITSNQKDNFPLRILPKLNKKIGSLNPENFSVINLTNKLKNIKSYDQFNSLFIDFQHPSEMGHLMIANELLKTLNVSQIKYNTIMNCKNLKFFFKKNKITFQKKYDERELTITKLIFLSHLYDNSLIKEPINSFIINAKNKKICTP